MALLFLVAFWIARPYTVFKKVCLSRTTRATRKATMKQLAKAALRTMNEDELHRDYPVNGTSEVAAVSDLVQSQD